MITWLAKPDWQVIEIKERKKFEKELAFLEQCRYNEVYGWGAVPQPSLLETYIMKYAKKSQINQKQPSNEQLETAFTIVAFASLKENQEPTDNKNILAESARIERCVEYYYKTTEHDLQYPEFAKKFLFENQKEIIYGDKFLNDYLDDVPEPEERNYFLQDMTVMI